MKHIFDDSDKNKYEAYTKEEVLEVIQEAISSGELPEEINGLVLTFKNPIDNLGYKIAFCTQAKYNELEAAETLEANCIYYITDDKTYEDFEAKIEEFEQLVEQLVETGLREKIKTFTCAFDFSKWNSKGTDYMAGEEINYLSLKNDTTYNTINAVNILPTSTTKSIAEAKVEYENGDNGYISYSLNPISESVNYITFTATNVSGSTIYSPSSTRGSVTRSTTFKLTIVDVYGNRYAKTFTINFKTAS